ncbi:MAG: hypothetical protein H0V81_13615 [Solirubrobacterales bacterium]|nr:hypothetical protein [Solirubrobacterales bacterium]
MSSRAPQIVLAVTVTAVAAVFVVVFGLFDRTDDHLLRASFDDAIQMTSGQEVRVAGRAVGEIRSIDLEGGRPIVELAITDDDVWPLPRGTVARSRWGSTSAYLGRYTELIPGPAGRGTLPENGLIDRDRSETAFELDEAYRIFRGRTKDDAGALVDELGETFEGREKDLKAGVKAAPGGLDETGALARELSADEERLRTLASAGDRTVSALAEREGELRALITNAASTFDELAAHTRAQQVALAKAPETFRATNTTLARLDTSLDGLDGLVSDLKVGAPALRQLARPTRTTLASLREVTPLAVKTLDAGIASTPRVRRLLDTATPVMPRLGRALDTAAPMLACIRPYAPEVAGFLSTWTGMTKNFDNEGHYARSFPLTAITAITPGTMNTSQQAVQNSALKYAMPRPPGLNAGKPMFLPECGAGPESLDPSKDPEGAGR